MANATAADPQLLTPGVYVNMISGLLGFTFFRSFLLGSGVTGGSSFSFFFCLCGLWGFCVIWCYVTFVGIRVSLTPGVPFLAT